MKKKPYEVATVEIEYNGDGETFNHFLSSVVREYVDAEPAAPEETAKKYFGKSKNNAGY